MSLTSCSCVPLLATPELCPDIVVLLLLVTLSLESWGIGTLTALSLTFLYDVTGYIYLKSYQTQCRFLGRLVLLLNANPC